MQNTKRRVKGKERIIYDNYDIMDMYRADAIEGCEADGNDTPSENDIWERCFLLDNDNREEVFSDLKTFFKGERTYLAVGTVGRWNGTFKGGFIFHSFQELFNKVGEDCDYFKFYDVNGHFYMQSSHHDGRNLVEIKVLTKRGEDYYQNWEYGSDGRTEEACHKQLFNRYSVLPNYMHTMYGCKKMEYEKMA